MLLKKLQHKDKVTRCTPTAVSLGIQSNTLYQFVYLHKLLYNSGSSLSEVSFHSLLAASSATQKKGLQESVGTREKSNLNSKIYKA